MKFNYKQVLKKLESIISTGIKYELKKIKQLLSLMDHPDKSFIMIHIAGTKGKGSTGAILSGLLSAHVSTGFFSSPHLVSPLERIRINNKQLTEEQFAANFSEIWPFLQKIEKLHGYRPSYFETMTALAFHSFRKAGIKVGIVEVGLGGRLDATNAARGDICILTKIHFDHTKTLGNTLRKISREKAGIIKRGALVVNVNKHPEVLPVIKKRAEAMHAKLVYSPGTATIKVHKEGLAEQLIDIIPRSGKTLRNIRFPLAGKHQLENLKAALYAVKSLKTHGINIKLRKNDFENIYWPGRLQLLSRKPTVLLDGAHNVISAQKLADHLHKNLKNRKAVFLLGMLGDKDYPVFVNYLSPFISHAVVTEVENRRKLPADDLALAVSEIIDNNKISIEPDNSNALKTGLNKAKLLGLPLIITGSIYLLGKILSLVPENGLQDLIDLEVVS